MARLPEAPPPRELPLRRQQLLLQTRELQPIMSGIEEVGTTNRGVQQGSLWP